jgi:osmotically-inducible protein OsmY
VGSYIDDATITTQIKSRFVESREVDAASIHVETLNGTVMLSGFAKSLTERAAAEGIARNVNGVRAVRNEIAVRP